MDSNACCSRSISELLSTVTSNEADARTCDASASATVSISEDELLTKLVDCVSKKHKAILEEREQLRSETARQSWIENFLDQEENGPREEEERKPTLSWFGMEQAGPSNESVRVSSSRSAVGKSAGNNEVVFQIKMPENDSKKTGRRGQDDEDDETTFRQVIQPSSLPPITRLPNFLGYVSTLRNIVVEDERVLPYLPYRGEEGVDPDFENQLLTKYEFKTSSSDKKDEKEEGDVFYKLVQAVAQEKNRLVDGRRRMAGQACETRVSEVVFKAISISCPHMGSPDELKKKFLKMEAPSAAIPNIDGPNAQLLPVEETMKAYKSQFCRRCFKYGCLFHHHTEADSVIPKKAKLQTETRQDLEAESKICGPDCCYRLDEFASNRNSSRNDSVNVNNDVDMEMEGAASSSSNGVIWSEGDKSFFLVVRKINPNDFCGIARLMMTKNITCREVYLFAKNGGYIVPDAVGPASEAPLEQQSKGTKEFVNKWRDYHIKRNKDQKKKEKEESQQSQGDEVKAKKLKKKDKKLKAGQEVENSDAGQEVENSEADPQVKKCDTIIRHQFVPCNHPGISCDSNSCPCFARGYGNFCEKYCHCSSECMNRFLGCDCRGSCNNTKTCLCFEAERECDPDLCKKCGADQPTDVKVVKCKNVGIQRGMFKHTLRGPSDVAGWGLFLKDSAQKDDFIIEYTGEIISSDEAERRGFIYDRLECSYMFTINEEYLVDAGRKGNKSRFANSSTTKDNCYVKVSMVNGDHRIGLYAKRDIAPGEEILFDYGVLFNQKCIQSTSK